MGYATIIAEKDGQDGSSEKIKCPSDYIDYFEDILYVGPNRNTWYRFETKSDCCGTFRIYATDEVEMPPSEDGMSRNRL